MSVNQSRDKNEPSQHRRSGRSGNPASQRNFSGGAAGGGKGGGGGSTNAPPSSSFYAGKSFKKVDSNAQGAQTRVTGNHPNVNLASPNSSTFSRAVQNGAHIQSPIKGTPDASSAAATVKPIDASIQKSSPGLPKAPQSNTPSSYGPVGATGPTTPAKGPPDSSRPFPLQFGSISPGVMNVMQVPARTNSAPPNLDEQKRAQARLESLKTGSFPNPPVPKQNLPRKDVGPVDQPNVSETHSITKEKRDLPASAASMAAHNQKPSGPPMPSVSGVPIQMPYHQSQIHLPFGNPNPPMQSQGVVNTSLPGPHPMHLPVGNPPPVPQQVFVQHHSMPSQGLMHQNQGMNYPSQMGPQIGNMGMGLGPPPQYQQPQMGNFGGGGGGGARRTAVKITHPDTHEEVRLGQRTDGFVNGGPSRSHPHGLPQSQPIPAFQPSPQMNYYQNSYNSPTMFFSHPGPNQLANVQTAPGSQPPRIYNQHVSKQVTVKPAVTAHVEKAGDSLVGSSPAMVKVEVSKTQKAGGSHKDSEPIATSSKPSEVTNKETVKEEPDKKDEVAPIDNKLPVGPTHGGSMGSVVEETQTLTGTNKDVLESSKKVISSTVADDVPDNEGLKLTAKDPVVETVESKERIQDSVDKNQDSTVQDVTASGNETGLDAEQLAASEPESLVNQQKEAVVDKDDGKSSELDALSAETSSLNLGSSHSDILDDQLSRSDCKKPVLLNDDSHAVSVSVPLTSSLSSEAEGSISPSSSRSVEKVKGNTTKGKKFLKEMLKNADARGTTSDLYMAYKRPEEKKELASAETDVTTKQQALVDSSEKDVRGPSKSEPDDWEEAAEISTPKLDGKQKHGSENDNDGMTKKYSRDFLLKFSEHCIELPEGFEITADISEVLIASSVNTHHEPYPSPGRPGPSAGPRLDRRSSNVGEDKQWVKPRLDMNYSGNAPGLRPGHGGGYGVSRTPRQQPPVQYAGGILSGPMPSPGGYGSMRNNSDSDRWQHVSGGYQKGLIPSPQTPMQMMHKAERKYEVGKITDEEEAKQRRLKGILNKLTPQNFEKLFEQVKEVNIDNADTLSGVISQIFDKALMEPTFVEMYANFCSLLAVELPDFSENEEKITFKRLLLNKCQEEFERGEREQEEANRTEEEGEVKQTAEQREEKRVKARRRMLGNIRLIGELYKKRMLTERIMHECIQKLLGQYENPDEEDIEALCKLMSTIGEMIDHSKAKEHIDAYFDMMFKLSNNMKLSSRVRFMLKDAIDLRKNKWQQRRKVEGPKKIEEVHRDAAQERQAQSNRLARGPNPNQSLRRGQPMDFGPKGSTGLPSNSQTGGFRGLTQHQQQQQQQHQQQQHQQQQPRGYGNQDSRFEERHAFENRTLSVPSRPMGEDSMVFMPQGGLASRMSSIRGQPLHETPDPRRGVVGPNGYGGYGSRDDLGSRSVFERVGPRPTFDQMNVHEHDTRNTGHRILPSSPPPRGRVSTPPQIGSSDKVFSEDQLHDMSIKAIKEFYSANDAKEVGLCIKDMNTPSFYPSMISTWINDSFERKDMERDSLVKLLVNLARSQEGMITQDSLIRGLESVLSTLEDAVNDAPKAPEFLGRLFGRLLLENVIPYKEVWRLIYEGGEEQGQLVEIGLAAEVLGVVLEMIKLEKGDVFLNNLRADSNLELEKFRPAATTKKTSRLDKFI